MQREMVLVQREVRMVPKGWKHPRRLLDGQLQPMHDQSYEEAVNAWKDGYEKWKTNPKNDCEYWEWEGPPQPRLLPPRVVRRISRHVSDVRNDF